MKNETLRKLNNTTYLNLNNCLNAIRVITDHAGIKEKQDTDFCYFITFEKEILISPGRTFHALWIWKKYNEKNEQTFTTTLQSDYSMSLSIKKYIEEAVNENKIILTEEMQKEIDQII